MNDKFLENVYSYLTPDELIGNMMLQTQEVRELVNAAVSEFKQQYRDRLPIKVEKSNNEVWVSSTVDENGDPCMNITFAINGGTGEVKTYKHYPCSTGWWRLTR